MQACDAGCSLDKRKADPDLCCFLELRECYCCQPNSVQGDAPPATGRLGVPLLGWCACHMFKEACTIALETWHSYIGVCWQKSYASSAAALLRTMLWCMTSPCPPQCRCLFWNLRIVVHQPPSVHTLSATAHIQARLKLFGQLPVKSSFAITLTTQDIAVIVG